MYFHALFCVICAWDKTAALKGAMFLHPVACSASVSFEKGNLPNYL